MTLTRSLYLASASPRRAEILQRHGIPFSRIPNLLYQETLCPDRSLREALRDLSLRKAKTSAVGVSGLVLAADTVVVLHGQVLGKPRDQTDAVSMLRALSNATHEVITAFSLWDTYTQTAQTASDVTGVRFRCLSDQDIGEYLACFDVMDKAGAYGVQDVLGPLSSRKAQPKNAFVAEIMGSYWTVMGLPIGRLLRSLKKYVIVPAPLMR